MDKNNATRLYKDAQDMVSRDLPIFPLWYPSNMVVSSRRIGNIQVNASGDWDFVKNVTVN
jgi:ABC-type transport system substrate-binding protein